MAPLSSSSRNRPQKSALVALAVAGAAAWRCLSVVSDTSFVAGSSGRVIARDAASVARGAFTFGLKADDKHQGFLTKQEDSGLRCTTVGTSYQGHWNTVLGDKALPASGRSYWEVKFVKKPTDAWEYIGVAEANADPTQPLIRNREGAGWFLGSNWEDSFVYTHMAMQKKWQDDKMAQGMEFIKAQIAAQQLEPKETERQLREQVESHYTGPGTHVGQYMEYPRFEKGRVVGIDYDGDDGSLAFWADGKFLGIVRDLEGKPLNLKGRKVMPALSVFGRNTGNSDQGTIMEVRTGLDAPERPQLTEGGSWYHGASR
ncbi:unnamed protein product [Polarella glacialis]|uniref:Uncharacterized protein n=1 Tax=Polarella glacialis TaxID=89957 RepID=A0A813E1Y4_POLGL|nr:unnamed protein product [Polarella glacialis]